MEGGRPQIVFEGGEVEILIEPKLDASQQVPDVCQEAAHLRVSSFHRFAFGRGRLSVPLRSDAPFAITVTAAVEQEFHQSASDKHILSYRPALPTGPPGSAQ